MDYKFRQQALAKQIGAAFCGFSKVMPLGHHSSVDAADLEFEQWLDMRVCDLAWWQSADSSSTVLTTGSSIMRGLSAAAYIGNPAPW